jgi:hypothetical protein
VSIAHVLDRRFCASVGNSVRCGVESTAPAAARRLV